MFGICYDEVKICVADNKKENFIFFHFINFRCISHVNENNDDINFASTLLGFVFFLNNFYNYENCF